MISFAAPLFLLTTLIAFPLLIYIYRKKQNEKKKIIPSLFFFNNLNKAVPTSRKLKIPLRLLFELLIASLFILYLSGASVGITSGQALIVFDNSLSSGCTLISGESCLSTLKRSLNDELTDKYTYSIQSTSKVLSEEASLRSVSNTIDSLVSEYSESVTGINADGFDHLYYVSDKKALTSDPTKVTVISLNTDKKPNCGLKNILSDELLVTCSGDIKQAVFEVDIFEKDSLKNIAKKTFDLKKGENKLTFQELPKKGVIRLKNDGNSLDNEFWISETESRVEIFVDSPLSIEELGIRSLKKFSFSKDKSKISKLMISHRKEAKKENIPTLSILPLGCSETKNQITRWENENPILKFISLETFSPSRLCITKGDENFIFAQKDSVASISENSVTLGFEIFPFEGSKTPRESILLINALDYLANNLQQLNTSPIITSTYGNSSKKPGLYENNSVYNFYSEAETLSDNTSTINLPTPTGSKKFEERTFEYLLFAILSLLIIDIVFLARRIF